MRSLRSNRAPFRLHVSLAATVFLAACAGQPSDETGTAAGAVAATPGACSGGEKSQAERQKTVALACEQAVSDVSRCLADPRSCLDALSTQGGECHTALEELACESTDSREEQVQWANRLKEQIARASAGPSDISSVTGALSANCPSNLSNATTSGSCYCPPLSSFGSLWGTGVYTSDSHLCTAAVHSGVISASVGGEVSYTLLPGRSAYCKSTQNGVTSSSYGSYSSSFSVGGAELPMVAKESVSHAYTARNVSGNYIRSFTAGASCLVKPVSIVYVSDNDGDLLAIGGDGTRVVIDGAWLPNWDSYSPVSTTRTDCPSSCPN
ncbi:hypothetical protein F0U61_17270 [Archangium violaceum]|uniref:LCCL domain-containing protein n=1 Tax=Archangium violaceum TaxID=83451 RepID=UPI002B314222|nr:hypothetical protein F0U61_17270 [Archangium violaceum]